MALDPDNGEFQVKTTAFQQWLQQMPGTVISPKIEIADLRKQDAGRRIVAIQDIEEDEELFRIPLSAVLSVQNSGLQKEKPDLLRRLDSWNSLVLAMIYEDGLKAHSKWYSYFNILPSSFNTLIYWSPSELAELQGSAVLGKIGKRGADKSFKEFLLPVMRQNTEIFGSHARAFSGENAESALLHLAHRMATLIMAYAFDLELEDSSSDEFEEADGSSQSAYDLNKGLVPLADLSCADGNLNNANLLQHEESMTMLALKRIHKGEQICNDLGQLPRSDLLRRYGYVTDIYKQWDVVEIDIDLITQASSQYNKLTDKEKGERLELAARWEVLQDGYDLARPMVNEPFRFDRTLTLTIAALLHRARTFEEAPDDPPDEPPHYLYPALNQVLKAIVAARQEAYSTTIAEDVSLLGDPTMHERKRMAIGVRLGEKEILAMAANEAERKINEISSAGAVTLESNQVKKRKI